MADICNNCLAFSECQKSKTKGPVLNTNRADQNITELLTCNEN